MEGFTPTLVDGKPVEINAENTQQNAEEQKNDGQNDGQRLSENDANGEHGQNEVPKHDEQNAVNEEKNVVTQGELPTQELTFGSEAFELDPVKPEAPVPVATPAQAAPDLLTFINENKDLLTEFNTLNRDFDALDPSDLISANLKSSYPDLSESDIKVLLSDFEYDEENDDQADIVRKKMAFQKAIGEAKQNLSARKDQLTQELATRNFGSPTQQDLQAQELQQTAINTFKTGTQSFFTQNFEGFEFNVGDNQGIRVKVNNADGMLKQQSDINNLLGKFFTGDGMLEDPKGYHTAIAIASNPDQFMEFAYQKGKSDQATAEAKQSKNIDMTGRSATKNNDAQTKWRLVD